MRGRYDHSRSEPHVPRRYRGAGCHRFRHITVLHPHAQVTIETVYGPVGLVHADVSDLDWDVATALLEAGASGVVDTALLGVDGPEEEVYRDRSRPVEGLRALVHGHFVVDEVERLANRWNIDTGATFPGRDRLTLLQVNDRCLRPSTFDVVEASAASARSPRSTS